MSYTLSQLIRRNIIGKCETILQHSNKAILTDIHIQEPYRRYHYGSVLLKDTEAFLVKEHHVECIELLVWKHFNHEKCTSRFFEDNQYVCEDMSDKHIYDDGEQLYQLCKYSKQLSLPQNNNHPYDSIIHDDIFHQTL